MCNFHFFLLFYLVSDTFNAFPRLLFFFALPSETMSRGFTVLGRIENTRKNST
jgi:hypothetical protein